jgi:hypothetical protein
MKTKVYICKFDDSIVLAKKCESSDVVNLYMTSKVSDIKHLYKITKVFRSYINKRHKSYLTEYIVWKEYFMTHYVYIGDF